MRNLSSLIITSFVHRRWLVWQNTEKVVNHLFSGTSLRGVFSAFLVWRSEYSNLLLIKPFPDLVHKRSPSEEQDHIEPERESGCIMCALGELVELRDVGVVICPRPQTVLKVSARVEKSVPLYRGDNEFSILTGGTFTFKTVSPEVERVLKSEAVCHYVKGGQDGRPYYGQGKNLDDSFACDVHSGSIEDSPLMLVKGRDREEIAREEQPHREERQRDVEELAYDVEP